MGPKRGLLGLVPSELEGEADAVFGAHHVGLVVVSRWL
jgi:hypothetical protein